MISDQSLLIVLNDKSASSVELLQSLSTEAVK